jgi:succinate dehydrogenase / fumarate reductase, membrane anchor subunit
MAVPQSRAPLRTPLGRAIGLGSAKEGVEHWWRERITAIALVPLCLWFVAEIIHHAGTGRIELIAWLKHPIPAVLLLLLLATTFHHTALGLQVVVEDYVGHEGARFGLIIAIRLLCVLFAVLGIFAVLRLAFGA